MKKIVLKKGFAALVFSACALLSPCGVFADASNPIEDCAKELLLSYFPAPIVNETLKRFDVPQDKWDAISKSLASKDKDVVKTVEQKASTMNPNPLKDPQQRQAAVKLFRDTLLQVFSDAMKENGVTDSSKFQAMLDDIQQQKAKMFAMCMERHKQKAQKQDITEGADSEESESDEDDDDNDDEDEEEETVEQNGDAETPQKSTSK
ncbi:MAG: hypothetical protein WCF65_02495 [Parachlamydiaceae bacterium]